MLFRASGKASQRIAFRRVFWKRDDDIREAFLRELRARAPGLRKAVSEDARVTCLHRGERSEFHGRADVIWQIVRLMWVSDAFTAHGIESWEFDVLAALRRAGSPYELSPGKLLRQTLVTSGTMTNRVDRLTARGLVERLPDPKDRRGVLVRLTIEGKAAVDGAFEALLAAEADLLSDLRKASKRAAYLQLSSECWYAIREGIAAPEEIPSECGVLVAGSGGLEVARPAPRRPMQMPFQLWIALARATPLAGWRLEDEQACLGDTSMS